MVDSLFRWLTIEKGITPIPPSAFYTSQTKEKAFNLGKYVFFLHRKSCLYHFMIILYEARFAFCKTDELLAEAKIRFQKLSAEK
jgi:hypothetical protein